MSRATAYRRRSPRDADNLYALAGRALRDSAPSTEVAAECLGVSERMIRYMIEGVETSKSMLGRFLEVVASLPNPFPLLTAVKIAALTRIIVMDHAQLAREYREAHAEETRAQAELDLRQIGRGCLAEIEEKAVRHAHALERLAALAAECRKKKIDPWAV
jgi:hypothetical protein